MSSHQYKSSMSSWSMLNSISLVTTLYFQVLNWGKSPSFKSTSSNLTSKVRQSRSGMKSLMKVTVNLKACWKEGPVKGSHSFVMDSLLVSLLSKWDRFSSHMASQEGERQRFPIQVSPSGQESVWCEGVSKVINNNNNNNGNFIFFFFVFCFDLIIFLLGLWFCFFLKQGFIYIQ